MAKTLISDFLTQSPFLFGGWDQGLFANGTASSGASGQQTVSADSSYEQEMKLALQHVLQTEDMDWGESEPIDGGSDSQEEGREAEPALPGIPILGIGGSLIVPNAAPPTLLAALNTFSATTEVSLEAASARGIPRFDLPMQPALRLVSIEPGGPALPETAAFALSLKIASAPSRAVDKQFADVPEPSQDFLPVVQRIAAALQGSAIKVISVQAMLVSPVDAAAGTEQPPEWVEMSSSAPEAAPLNAEAGSEADTIAPGNPETGQRNDFQQTLPDFEGATERQADRKRDRNEDARPDVELTNPLVTNERMPGVDALQGVRNAPGAERPGEAHRAALSSGTSEQIQALRQEATQRNPISHLVVELEGAGATPVRLRLMNSSGQVRLEVHSPEPDVRHVLRSDLGDLVSRLERAGFQVPPSAAAAISRVAPAEPVATLPPHWVDPAAGPLVDTKAASKSEPGQFRDTGKGRERRGSGYQGVKR